MSDLIKVGGVWAKTDENGNTALFGRFTYDTKILILPNKYRKEEKEPTHIVFLAPVDHDKQGGSGGGDRRQQRPPAKAPNLFSTPDIPPGDGEKPPF